MPQIVIIEDDLDFSKSLELVLGLYERQALIASSAEQALALIAEKAERIRLIFIDIKLPQMDGIACLQEILSQWPDMKCVIMSGLRDRESMAQVRAAGAVDVLLKPFRTESFLALVNKYI